MNSINLNLKDASISYNPQFLAKEKAWSYFESILNSTPWRQDDITVYGKTFKQPRLTALFGNNSKSYSYSNIEMHPIEFTQELLEIKTKIESLIDKEFSTCLINLYRNGNDSNGWHSDDEKELGINPIIASISLGSERWFHLKHKKNKELKYKMILEHGSLLIMEGSTQHKWLHQIPKTKKDVGQRINLTFRIIK